LILGLEAGFELEAVFKDAHRDDSTGASAFRFRFWIRFFGLVRKSGRDEK
jgi:hypothetical protein